MKNIVVIAGGNSSEYGISIQSGDHVFESIDESRYHKYLMVLKGREWLVKIGEAYFPVDRNDFSFSRDGEKVRFDFAYITIHGNPGENGLLQGYLDMMGIPYGGCNVLASAMTFDKYTCNTYLKGFGVNVAPSVLLREGTEYTEEEILAEVGLPCFVKPNAEGSSYGVSKVKECGQLKEALQNAFAHCSEVLVEQFIDGKEFTCGVAKSGRVVWLLPVAEVIPKKDFFDFEAKYDPTLSEEIVPARIPDALATRIQQLSSLIYDLMRCEGIIRIDYMLRGDEIVLLEVNTTPGMTSNSFIPKMVRAMNGSLREMLTTIIEHKLS